MSALYSESRQTGVVPLTIYTFQKPSKITTVEVTESNIIYIYGHFNNELDRFDEGVLGKIKCDEFFGGRIAIVGATTNQKITDLFKAIIKFEPKFESLVAILNKKVKIEESSGSDEKKAEQKKYLIDRPSFVQTEREPRTTKYMFHFDPLYLKKGQEKQWLTFPRYYKASYENLTSDVYADGRHDTYDHFCESIDFEGDNQNQTRQFREAMILAFKFGIEDGFRDKNYSGIIENIDLVKKSMEDFFKLPEVSKYIKGVEERLEAELNKD